MKKVLIFGGSFNPFHNGHDSMLNAAKNLINPDEIWLIPSKCPPHKQQYLGATDEDRYNMLSLYANNKQNVKVLDIELKSEGITYTVNTLKELKRIYPDYKFYFLIGGDSIMKLKFWYKPDEIINNAAILVVGRGDNDGYVIEEEIKNLFEMYGGDFYIIPFELDNTSSTMVKELIKNNLPFEQFLPASISEYINKNNLYKNIHSLSELEIKDSLKKELSEKRFIHSLGVADTAKELALINGYDENKAYLAGLLHDCAKNLKSDELITLCRQNNVSLSEIELASEAMTLSLVHSKAGMVVAKNKYLVDDKDILSSIFYHTVGRENMTMLEKIIFVADFIEPNRTQKSNPSLDVIREETKKNLDKGVYLVVNSTYEYLLNSGGVIDPNTLKTLEYYKKESL